MPNGPFECYDDVLSISSGPLHLSCSSLVPECIDKNCFEEARVLLQLDKKFIPVISGETLLLVDQVRSRLTSFVDNETASLAVYLCPVVVQ